MRASYTVQRNVCASTSPDSPATTLIAMVLFQLPGEAVTRSLAINEDLIRTEGGGNPLMEEMVIRRELTNVLAQMSAGTATPELVWSSGKA